MEYGVVSGMGVGGTTGLTAGACTGSCNAIRFNVLDGVGDTSQFGAAPTIHGNRISDNGGLGIDIFGNGPTPNDAGDALPQNFPVVTVVWFDSGSGTTTLQGTLKSIASTSFSIEVFTSTAADPSGFGEGQTYRGSTTCLTDGSGNGSWSQVVAGSMANISATASGTGRGTSEFSAIFMDADGDGYGNGSDNCPAIFNADQIDSDFDGLGDPCDDCPSIVNPGQEDQGGDSSGDVCDADVDGDGAANGGDCAPTNSGAFAIPTGINGLSVSIDKETLSWTSAAPVAGSGTVYDVVRGLAGDLPVDSGPSETCIISGLAGTSTATALAPAPDQTFWYLVRGRNVCGIGTYGFASGGTERTSTACP